MHPGRPHVYGGCLCIDYIECVHINFPHVQDARHVHGGCLCINYIECAHINFPRIQDAHMCMGDVFALIKFHMPYRFVRCIQSAILHR